ncbi:hypothetical protein Tco_0560612, partial [Tanacetum coccineum]
LLQLVIYIAAMEETHQVYNQGLPLIYEAFSLEMFETNQPNVEEPTPTQPRDVATEETQTTRAPRVPIKQRGKSERITKKRKSNLPVDGSGKSKDRPFSD